MRRVLLLAVLLTFALVVTPSSPGSVLGGRPASQPYPWMAALRDDGDQFCGASLIAPQYALTAAHCVSDGQEEGLSLLFNQPKLSGSGGEEINVAEVIVHEDYTDPAEGDDIAVLRLATPSVQPPIRIGGTGDRALWEPGDTSRVIGWGAAIFLVGPGSDDLQEVDVPIVSDSDCQNSYPEFDEATMVCAGEETGGKDSCQGDSGGPLFVFDAAGAPVQVGTVSYGLGCGFPGGFYGVYGRVGDATLRDWIASKVPNLSAAAPAPAPAPGPAPAPPPPGPTATPAPSPTPASTRVTRLRFEARLGSARAIRRRRTARLVVLATGPVRNLRATVTSTTSRRVLARGSRARLNGRGGIRLRFTRAARPRAGALRLKLRAIDADGNVVRAAGVVALRR